MMAVIAVVEGKHEEATSKTGRRVLLRRKRADVGGYTQLQPLGMQLGVQTPQSWNIVRGNE